MALGALKEGMLAMKLKHPCILSCETAFLGGETDDQEQIVCLVTRLCEGGDMDKVVHDVCNGVLHLTCFERVPPLILLSSMSFFPDSFLIHTLFSSMASSAMRRHDACWPLCNSSPSTASSTVM